MYIYQPNKLIELLVRIRYCVLQHMQQTESDLQVRYCHRRWYKLDPQGRIVKVARTYFEVMQPY